MSGAIRILEPIERGPYRGSVPAPPDVPPRTPAVVLGLAVVAALVLLGLEALPEQRRATEFTPPPPTSVPPAELEVELVSSPIPGGSIGPYPLRWRPLIPEAHRGSAINDFVESGGFVVAVGTRGTDAAVWVANTHGYARENRRVNDHLNGTSARPRVMRAVAVSGTRMVAVGSVGTVPVAWVSNGPDEWTLVKTGDAGFDPAATLSDIAASGHGFVALGSLRDEPRLWWSADGTSWIESDLPDEARPLRVVATEHGFLAPGDHGVGDARQPAIWLSKDGLVWRASTGLDDGGTPGVVSGLTTAAGGGLIAVGALTDAAGSSIRGAAWASSDGEMWHAVGERDSSLLPRTLRWTVTSLGEHEGRWRAEIEGPGGMLEMTRGPLASGVNVDRVTAQGVTIRGRGGTTLLGVGETMALGGVRSMIDVARLGNRVVVVGVSRDVTAASAQPALWVSEDDGATWAAATVVEPALDLITGLSVYRGSLLATAHASDAGGPGPWAWIADLDTSAAGDAAVSVVTDFAIDVARGGAAEVVAALAPERPPGLGLGRSSWPGLPASLRFWAQRGDTYLLDQQRVRDFVQYASTAGADMHVGKCVADVAVAVAEEAHVTCAYAGGSGVLGTLGFAGTTGTLRAELIDGRIASLSIDEVGPHGLWDRLARWSAQEHPDRFATAFGGGDAAGDDTPYSAASAQAQLALASELAQVALQPDAPVSAPGPFGEMQVALAADTTAVREMAAVVTVPGGFAGRTGDGEVWVSSEGVGWRALPGPGGAVISVVEDTAGPGVVTIADGAVSAASLDAATNTWRSRVLLADGVAAIAADDIVVSGGRVFLAGWTEGSFEPFTWWEGSGREPSPMPWPADAEAMYFPTRHGVGALITNQPGAGAMWHLDGGGWLAADAPVGLGGLDLLALRNLDDRLVAIALSKPGRCDTAAVDELGCAIETVFLTSEDGSVWSQAEVTAGATGASGKPPWNIAVGPLGLVAWSAPPDPIVLWSRDGGVWHATGFELPVGSPTTGTSVEWVAVGSDRVVMGLLPPRPALFRSEVLVVVARRSP